MLGSTQTVDMETTRKNDFGRVLVAVLNPSLIPEKLDVVIGDHYFELDFEVEKWGFDENGDEAVIEWSKGGGDLEGEGEELLGNEEGQERRSKKQKKEGSNSGATKDTTGDSTETESWREQVLKMSEREFEVFLRKKAGRL
jgi:hypothetical protein